VRLAGTRGTYAALGLAAEEVAGYDALTPGVAWRIGSLSVTPVGVPHDAAEPLAFVIAEAGVAFGHATDLGHLSRGVVEALRACHALLIESNYDPAMLRDGPYPWSLKERILSPLGHLSNGDVARYLASGLPLACRRLVLAHLSQKNNHPELVRMAADEALRRAGRSEVAVTVCEREGTGWIEIAADAPRRAQLRLFEP
jgi:phosphoribosyl 1,2-cyclic phosphodiesterase